MLKNYDYGFITWLQMGDKAYTKNTAESYETTCRLFLQGDGFSYPYVGGYYSFIKQLKVETLDQRIEESTLNNQSKSCKSATKRIFSLYAEYIKSKDEEYNAQNNACLDRLKSKVAKYVNQQCEETSCLNFLTKKTLDEKVVHNMQGRTFRETLEGFIAKKWRMRKIEDFFKLVDINKASYYRWVKEENPGIRNKTLYMIAIALELNFEETKELIESAGRNFNSPREKFDIACKVLIEEKIYDIEMVNEFLKAYCDETIFIYWYDYIGGKAKEIK